MTLKTELYPHQRAAFEKLKGLRVGALYMGLQTGKTRTALEFIHYRLQAGKIDKAIYLCPCNILMKIREDFDKHAAGWDQYIELCGIETLSGSSRRFQELYALATKGTCMVIVDESILIKNHRAIRSERIVLLGKVCRYRLILSGIPVTRDETDLYYQWYFLDWRILGYSSYHTFARNHIVLDPAYPGKIVRVLNADYLTRKISPYCYQITTEDAVGKTEVTYRSEYIGLPPDQRQHYIEVFEELMQITDEQVPETVYKMLSGLQAVIGGFRLKLTRKKKSIYWEKERFFESYMYNPRMKKLLELLENQTGKVIIIAKYTAEIEEIADMIRTHLDDEPCLYHGGTTRRQRDDSYLRFMGVARYMVANKNCFGYGLSFQNCQTIIFFSDDFDYGTTNQTEGRIQGIGQTGRCIIYKLIAERTIDERIQGNHGKKSQIVAVLRRMIAENKDIKTYLNGGMKDDLPGAEDDPEEKDGKRLLGSA